ncbi:MAG: ammonia-forming cytochrome c nitrite reductase [Bacteroidetes bacterium]|nr:ammonia-forming cytochrome c nitrite reductase [Bacteroidota bacterium]
MNSLHQEKSKKGFYWLLFAGSLIGVFLLGLLVASITERRAEAVFAYSPKVELADFEPRNEVWGQNFPWQYESYRKTQETDFRTPHGGNAMRDMLEEAPELVVLWAGYAFSKDYNQGRGHSYAITDTRNTLRTGGPLAPDKGMPSTCWTCKSPDVPRMMNQMGVKEFYSTTWAALGHEHPNSIGCADCHDPKTMNLTITRPALIEAYQAMGKDITKATHQEMRSLVCAQCHVEYYFDRKRPGAEGAFYLTFPWTKGMGPEEMLAYYDEFGFSDWTHPLSKAPMLKSQHPDYEVYTTGIHAERGVSCADCHMPYVSEGGLKYSNHHVTSPLKYVSQACQTCHRESEATLMKNVYDRQNKVAELRHKAEKLIVHAHVEAKAAWDAGATEAEMKDILYDIRAAQWFWDYVAASHGGSFHAPVESARVMGKAIDRAQSARVKLARVLATKGITAEIPYPDISTKAKAQAFIGLDMDALRQEKQVFKEQILPEWDRKAAERQAAMPMVRK